MSRQAEFREPNKLPIMHSDFDGVIVQVPKSWNLFGRMTKMGLQPVSGTREFLEGVKSKDVVVGNIISRRPDALGRRHTTARSVSKAGLGGYFGDPRSINLEGSLTLGRIKKSEEFKARRVLASAEERVTGMIEDKPHKLGFEMLRVMMSSDSSYEPVVLGVVDHPEAETRVLKLADIARKEFGDSIEIEERDSGIQIARNRKGSFVLDVVLLEPFSLATGEAFGKTLQDFYSI